MGPRIRSRYPVKDPVRFHDRHSSRWDEDVPRTTGARWTEMADNERGRGPSIVAPYTYHGDCLCWLMATYVAHTSHYEAVLDPHEPLLSPWLQRRRVMANTLRIKCILSLSAWWHRCHSTIQITLTLPIPPCGSSFYPFLPSPLSVCLLLRLFSSFVLFFFPPYTGEFEASPPFSTDQRWRFVTHLPDKGRGICCLERLSYSGRWNFSRLFQFAVIRMKIYDCFWVEMKVSRALPQYQWRLKCVKLYDVWRKMAFNIVVQAFLFLWTSLSYKKRRNKSIP